MSRINEWIPTPTEESANGAKLHLPQPLTWKQLCEPVDLSNNLLGNRWIERGQGGLMFGPAGCGKSVAALQACVEWSAGLNGLHIKPAFPLKIVELQTEDSLDDTRESLAGILASSLITPKAVDLIKANFIILPPVPGGTAADLGKLLEAVASEYKPDLIHVNPLLAFCSGDPTRELGGLLYQVIDPIIKRHKVGFLGVHHTPKTNKLDTSGYGAHDHQYLAAGDARVANWPRGMIQIEEVKFPLYRFRMAKRGSRSGWTWQGKPTNERYFRHHESEVRWIDATPEQAAEASTGDKYDRILEVLPEPSQEGLSRERVRDLAKKKLNVGKDRCDSWLKLAIEDGSVTTVNRSTESNRRQVLFRKADKI